MTPNQKEAARDALLLALLSTRDTGPISPAYGICDLCEEFSDGLASERFMVALLREIFKTWPRRTRRRGFPVPHPHLDPVSAFYCANPTEMWSRECEYGRARRELLDHCIKELMG